MLSFLKGVGLLATDDVAPASEETAGCILRRQLAEVPFRQAGVSGAPLSKYHCSELIQHGIYSLPIHQVFHLDGYLKRAVTLNAMTAHGWDFDDVQVLSDRKYMDILPTGPPQD